MDFQSGFGPNKNEILAFTGSLCGREEEEREKQPLLADLITGQEVSR